MAAGSVSVADDGTETKSGMAEAIYDAMKLMAGDNGGDIANTDLRKGLTAMSNRLADALVTYITTNAQTVITTSDGQLQQFKTEDTDAPTATRYLGII